MENINKSGFFYIKQPTDVPYGIYKIGIIKTSECINKKINSFFLDTKYIIKVNDISGFKYKILEKFNIMFNNCNEFGEDYYDGNIKRMIDLSHCIWLKYGNINHIHIQKKIF